MNTKFLWKTKHCSLAKGLAKVCHLGRAVPVQQDVGLSGWNQAIGYWRHATGTRDPQVHPFISSRIAMVA